MIKKSFLLGAIASVIAINSVFADTIVTSKQYVDTTRQVTIPAAETNIETPGVSVVTYTDTAGTIGERGIFNPETDFENEEIASGHEGDLLDAGSILPALVEMNNTIQRIEHNMPDFDDLPETTVTYKTCVGWANEFQTDGNCILWELSDAQVYGKCHWKKDCKWNEVCNNGICKIDPNIPR